MKFPEAAWQRSVLFFGVLAALVVLALYLGLQKNLGALQFAQLILDGLRGGAIYGLIAMGFIVVYNVSGVINFAQGAFVMLGAMLAVTFWEWEVPLPPAWHLLLSLLLAVVATFLAGLLIERVAIHPARHASPLTLIIITVGVYITLQGLALLLWGAGAHIFPAFTTLKMGDQTYRWAGLVIKAQSFWIWGTTALVLAGQAYFFERTLLGKALRACAVNRRGAQLVGINPERMSLAAFGLATVVGAIGGVVIAPLIRPSFDIGLMLGLKGFVAAILGGLVSPSGAVLGGLLLGLLENVIAGVTKAGMKDVFAFLIMILTLLFRPQGLMGVRPTRAEEETT